MNEKEKEILKNKILLKINQLAIVEDQMLDLSKLRDKFRLRLDELYLELNKCNLSNKEKKQLLEDITNTRQEVKYGNKD